VGWVAPECIARSDMSMHTPCTRSFTPTTIQVLTYPSDFYVRGLLVSQSHKTFAFQRLAKFRRRGFLIEHTSCVFDTPMNPKKRLFVWEVGYVKASVSGESFWFLSSKVKCVVRCLVCRPYLLSSHVSPLVTSQHYCVTYISSFYWLLGRYHK
jgi:hypothetical protein